MATSSPAWPPPASRAAGRRAGAAASPSCSARREALSSASATEPALPARPGCWAGAWRAISNTEPKPEPLLLLRDLARVFESVELVGNGAYKQQFVFSQSWSRDSSAGHVEEYGETNWPLVVNEVHRDAEIHSQPVGKVQWVGVGGSCDPGGDPTRDRGPCSQRHREPLLPN